MVPVTMSQDRGRVVPRVSTASKVRAVPMAAASNWDDAVDIRITVVPVDAIGGDCPCCGVRAALASCGDAGRLDSWRFGT
jgi:hypothetical protein